MKQIIYLAIAITFIAGCKKKDRLTEADIYPPVPKVRSVISTSYSQNYEYDEKGRFIRLRTSGSTFPSTEVSYTEDKAIVTNRNPITGVFQSEIAYTLNNKGLGISSISTALSDIEYLYEYNADNYLINQKTKKISTGIITKEEKKFYSSGKLDSIQIFNNGSYSNTYKETNEYYAGIVNTLDNYNFGRYYSGKRNGLVIKKESTYPYPNYYYTYDTQNRIVKATYSYTDFNASPPSTVSVSTNYSYY